MARVGMAVVLSQLTYVRDQGLGADVVKNANAKAILISSSIVILPLAILNFKGVLLSLIAISLAAGLVYWYICRPIKGATGDVYGAIVETSESMVLVALIFLIS